MRKVRVAGRSLLVCVGLVALVLSVFAQEPPGPREGQRPERMGPGGPPPFPPGQDMREGGVRREGREPFGPGVRMDGPIASPFDANAVDSARFQIAAMLVEQKKYEDAIGELLKTAEESPDETAGAAAHLSAGNIFRQCLKDTDKAVEQYREVKGRLTEMATRSIVETYQEAQKPEEAVKVLEDLLAKTQEPGQKIRLLNMTAEVYRRSGNADKAIEVLRKITGMLNYDDAEAMRRGWLDEEAELGKLQDRIQDLRAAGRNEEAERLQKQADEIKARKDMREALKKQKRVEKEPAKPEAKKEQ